ncbi:hypothetical protein [Bacillus sp. B15-48]|uniref:hypothetical protein n=1 Tax=Bacillus sp. B15-48 TaxID=1548601 RepID=UPI00193F4B7B|nr:hypothetical protein [Bacillus sp. B15-48]MBM4765465.1 hypothetical protein [Bacillus sp. B15-48]
MIIKEAETMPKIKVMCLLYELKGMVKTISDVAEYDEQYSNPIVDNLEEKIKEIISEIEK